MTIKYLTPNLKNYYQRELQKCIECKDPLWDLDKGLLSILTNINKNPNIQTILSKKTETIIYGNDYTALSYLDIAFTKNIEIKLPNELLNLIDKFKNEDVQLHLFDSDLVLNDEAKEEQKGAFNNPNLNNLEVIVNVEEYKDVKYFRIHLFDYSMKKHKQFWKCLEKVLVNI